MRASPMFIWAGEYRQVCKGQSAAEPPIVVVAREYRHIHEDTAMPGATEDSRPCPQPFLVWADDYISVNKITATARNTRGRWSFFLSRPFFVRANRYINVDGGEEDDTSK